MALRTQKMTKETNRAFLSAVAAAMLAYKRFPTKEEYTKDILQKYPFMRPSNGSPMVSTCCIVAFVYTATFIPQGGIVQSLIDRFMQFRRTKKDQLRFTPKATAIVAKPIVQSLTAVLQIPTTPAGEDKLSFERHSKAILSEMKKARGGNATVINDLVNRTYPMRRQDILLNYQSSL